jgi:hypothetical protein
MDAFLDYIWTFTTTLSVIGLIAILSGLGVVTWQWNVMAKDLDKPQPSFHDLARNPVIIFGGCLIGGGVALSAMIFTLRFVLPTGP